MADYIYTMEIRLTPDQLKGVNLVQNVARAAGITLYLTGGAIRDIVSGFTIRDLDFTVQGNPLKLQKDLERAGAQLAGHDEDVRTLFLVLPGNVRAEIGMAHTEHYEKVGKPPVIAPASTPGSMSGRVTVANRSSAPAPRVRAASSSPRSTFSSEMRMARTINGKDITAVASAAPLRVKMSSMPNARSSQDPMGPRAPNSSNNR